MRLRHVGVGLALACAPGFALAPRVASPVPAPIPASAPVLDTNGPPRTSVGYALLPLRNLGSDAAGARELQEGLCRALTERGAHFVSDTALDAVLRPRRVRYTDSLSIADARAVGEATGAAYALAGVVFAFVRGDEPQVGMSVRVIDLTSGERVQSAFVSLRGVDFRGLLGLGGIEDARELVERAVVKVLGSFGPQGEPLVHPKVADRASARLDRRAGPEQAGAPGSPARTDPKSRLALLPFVNRSTRADAGASFSEILGHTWFQETGAQIVEASELRSALVRARIRSLQEMDSATMAAIGTAIDVRWFVLGSVDRFGEETVVRDQRYPEVDVTVRIVDARTGLVVKSENLRMRGDDGEWILRAGVEHDPFALAARVARKLVIELESGP